MRRVLIIVAAAAALLSPFVAVGQDRGARRGGDGYERFQMADRDRDDRGSRGGGRDREDRGGYDRGGYGGRERDYGGPPPDSRGGRYDGRGGGYDPRAEPSVPRGQYSRSAPPPYAAAAPRQSWRQGQYLPPAYRGSIVRDPGRYRLRAPPPGYDWIGVGPDIYLMQRGTGMVLDTIPGGY